MVVGSFSFLRIHKSRCAVSIIEVWKSFASKKVVFRARSACLVKCRFFFVDSFTSLSKLIGLSDSIFLLNSFKSIAKFNFKNNNFLALKYSFYSAAPNYNTLLYRSNYENYNWDNEFDNSATNSISLNLILSNVFDLDIDLISVKKHIQFKKLIDDNSAGINNYSIVPVQYLDNLEVLKIKLARKINFGKFSIDSKLLLQKPISSNILSLPEIVSRNTFYYSTDMFKKALYLQTGFGVKYFSKFYMNGYDPLLSELYVQNDT